MLDYMPFQVSLLCIFVRQMFIEHLTHRLVEETDADWNFGALCSMQWGEHRCYEHR